MTAGTCASSVPGRATSATDRRLGDNASARSALACMLVRFQHWMYVVFREHDDDANVGGGGGGGEIKDDADDDGVSDDF